MKAYDSGFIKRVSKFSSLMFFDNLLYDATSESHKSYNQMAIETKTTHGIDISKQGIDQRFNEGAQKFIQSLISQELSTLVSGNIDMGWLKLFKRVNIKDSTEFDLNERLKEKLPGFGGSASKAGACIQYDFDIKSGKVNDLAITPASRSDAKDALKSIENVQEGDLIIRDLGYFSLPFYMAVQKIMAYFISRLNVRILVFEKNMDGKFERLDFSKLYQTMKENKISRMDKNVFIGENEKFPIRLIIELLPDGAFNERMRRINASQIKHSRRDKAFTRDYIDRARFNLFMTNIHSVTLDGETVAKIYKLRWQVELVFKTWKSIFGMHRIGPMKYHRLMCTLNARLLLILINWETFMVHRARLYIKTSKLISINKCFKTLKDRSSKLREILTNDCKGIEKWIRGTEGMFETKHWLERKKNKLGQLEILCLNIL